MSIEKIVDSIMSFPLESKVIITAPLVRQEKGSFQKLFDSLRADGYARVEVDGEMKNLSDQIDLNKNFKHDIDLVVDRLKVSKRQDKTACLCALRGFAIRFCHQLH